VRFVDQIEIAFLYHGPEEMQQGKKSLPRGVVIMPQMRYEMDSGEEYNDTTPYERIEAMAAAYGVPAIRMPEQASIEDMQHGLGRMLAIEATPDQGEGPQSA
jgi:hypothetical protein